MAIGPLTVHPADLTFSAFAKNNHSFLQVVNFFRGEKLYFISLLAYLLANGLE